MRNDGPIVFTFDDNAILLIAHNWYIFLDLGLAYKFLISPTNDAILVILLDLV